MFVSLPSKFRERLSRLRCLTTVLAVRDRTMPSCSMRDCSPGVC